MSFPDIIVCRGNNLGCILIFLSFPCPFFLLNGILFKFCMSWWLLHKEGHLIVSLLFCSLPALMQLDRVIFFKHCWMFGSTIHIHKKLKPFSLESVHLKVRSIRVTDQARLLGQAQELAYTYSVTPPSPVSFKYKQQNDDCNCFYFI